MGKIAYLLWTTDYDEDDNQLDTGTWVFKTEEPCYGLVKKIVYFEVE